MLLFFLVVCRYTMRVCGTFASLRSFLFVRRCFSSSHDFIEKIKTSFAVIKFRELKFSCSTGRA
jgi:hypothetical protein